VAALALLVSGTAGLQDAAANGDTRTLDIYHEHTQESGSITYRQNGRYVTEGLRQLNWILRDWRVDEQVEMDPKLFDIVWQVYREARATGPIHVNSAYRSPQTNAALRRRSRGVAEYSQHMRGKAMDFFLEGVSMARVREIGVRLQHGGVGFYPHSRHQFVHLDAGGVRSWPRLPDAQLARLFPDGRTVHIPKSGQPMAGYEDARATILARGGTVAGYSTYAEAGGRRKSLWASLFGGGEDEDEDLAGMPQRARVASADSNDSDAGMRGFFSLFGGSRAPTPPVPEAAPEAALPAETSPTPAIAIAVAVAVPLPPRRPAGLGHSPTDIAATKLASVSPVELPLPPARPGERRGEARPTPRAPVAGIGANDRAALKSLFAAAATPTGATQQASAEPARSFSRAAVDAPSAGGFNGPATGRTISGR
jgi:uncharacterized protein YcbK (DUF882 family)